MQELFENMQDSFDTFCASAQKVIDDQRNIRAMIKCKQYADFFIIDYTKFAQYMNDWNENFINESVEYANRNRKHIEVKEG